MPDILALRLLLCLSLLIESTSISVQHRHAQGHLSHAHGFGLVCEYYSSPARATTNGQTANTAICHGHLIVLGIEFHSMVDLSPSRPTPQTSARGDPQVTVGDTDDALNDALSNVRLGLTESGSLFVGPALPEPGFSLPPTGLQIGPDPTPRRDLCDRARGERSGVRLI